jgi:hypothetical protein
VHFGEADVMTQDTDFIHEDINSWDESDADAMARAKEVGDALCRAYPNHPWIVSWHTEGVLCVKNLAISSWYGFTIDSASLCSYKALVNAAVVAGGELLERANIPRDKPWDGQFALELAGSEPRFFKPH